MYHVHHKKKNNKAVISSGVHGILLPTNLSVPTADKHTR